MATKRIVLSEEQIHKDVDLTYKMINSISDEIIKKQYQKFIEKIAEHYFSAPASSNSNYHDACIGGLANHSLQVLRNFSAICKLWAPEIDKDSIIICALSHDIGKACTTDLKAIYIEETEKWKLEKGWYYYHNPIIRDGLTHAQRSVRLLQYFGVNLTDDQYLSILCHDGLFLDENQPQKNKFSRMSTLLHYADYWTSQQQNK